MIGLRGGQYAGRGAHVHLPALRVRRGPAAGWSSDTQATQQWNGQGAPGDDDSVVDLFSGPGGVEAWAMAAPTKQSLEAYTRATTRASAAVHPCPATPQTDQAITISGEPARLLNMQCPARSGFLVEIATPFMMGPPTCSHLRTRPAAATKTLIAPLSASS